MSTVNGLFMAGDVCGASGHKFSSGSHAEGRIAAKAAMVVHPRPPGLQADHQGERPTRSRPSCTCRFEVYEKYKTYTTDAEDINPNYIKPDDAPDPSAEDHGRVLSAAVSTWYMTSKTMLDAGLELLDMLKEDASHMAGRANLHELMRCWENYHRILPVEAHARHILFREETPLPRLLLPRRLRR